MGRLQGTASSLSAKPPGPSLHPSTLFTEAEFIKNVFENIWALWEKQKHGKITMVWPTPKGLSRDSSPSLILILTYFLNLLSVITLHPSLWLFPLSPIWSVLFHGKLSFCGLKNCFTFPRKPPPEAYRVEREQRGILEAGWENPVLWINKAIIWSGLGPYINQWLRSSSVASFSFSVFVSLTWKQNGCVAIFNLRDEVCFRLLVPMGSAIPQVTSRRNLSVPSNKTDCRHSEWGNGTRPGPGTCLWQQAGSPEDDVLWPSLLEQPVEGPLCAGEEVGWEWGAALARGAQVQLGHLWTAEERWKTQLLLSCKPLSWRNLETTTCFWVHRNLGHPENTWTMALLSTQ